MPELFAALVGVAFVMAGVVFRWILDRRTKQYDAVVKETLATFELDAKKQIDALREVEPSSFPLLLSTSTAHAPSGAIQGRSAISELREQLNRLAEQVEQKKDEIVEVQRIDPVLEATLKASIDNLTKRIEWLEKNLLSKWDVATVVLQLLGGFGIILSIVFAIVKYLLP